MSEPHMSMQLMVTMLTPLIEHMLMQLQRPHSVQSVSSDGYDASV